MIEPLCTTDPAEEQRSESYVLVLTPHSGRARKACMFMAEHGYWDDDSKRFVHKISSICTDAMTYQDAAAMHSRTKQDLAQRGFIYSFAPDGVRRHRKHIVRSDRRRSEPERVSNIGSLIRSWRDAGYI